jgi:hypothetical protein
MTRQDAFNFGIVKSGINVIEVHGGGDTAALAE